MLKVSCNCDDSERTIKNIYVFANGEKYSGQKVVLNQNRWHHILNDITLKLDPYFGKVEKLYTTSSGLTVYSFTDLQNNATYVASNRVRRYSNVKGGYTVDTEPTQEYFEHYLSSQLQRINKYKKLVYVRRDLLVIYIFRNGECGQSFKIVLTSDDLSSWSHILSYVALILDVPERCIKSLYSVRGNKICGPWELQHGASYVAVGYNQAFRKGCYHVDQKSTEVLTTGFPVVHKDKNLVCTHKVKRKMKPNFSWNHYDQYACTSAPAKKSPKKSRNGSKKSKRNSSQRDSTDMENKTMENTKKNKKVTVHMRIKNSAASSVMITRNSGDSSATSKKKKNWEEENSNTSDSDNNANCGICDCTTKTCSTSTKNKYGNEYQSEPTTPGTSNSDIPTGQPEQEQTERNLTWKHIKNDSQNSFKKGEKVTVHVQGGQAIIMGGSPANSKHSFAVRKSAKSIEKKKKQKKSKKHPEPSESFKPPKKQPEIESFKPPKKQSEIESLEPKKPKLKSSLKTKNNCSPSCGENDDCRFYKIAKPTMDKYKTIYCPNTSSDRKSKPKYNTILKPNRDNSDSRIKNKNNLILCDDAPKCKISHRRNFCKKVSAFLDSNISIDSLKGMSQSEKQELDTDISDDSSNIEYEQHSQPDSYSHNKSSCTICRIQLERKNLCKRKCK